MYHKFIWLFFVRATLALIAFDCGHEKMNQTRISVLSVENCKLELSNVVHENEDIQLLELNTVASTHIFQCKINVLQTVYYCGMFSHLSLVPGGLSTFIADVSQEEFINIHKVGMYKLQNGKVITNIKANSTTRFTEIIAGSVDSKGSCEGVSYSYGTNSWNNVVVMHAMEFTITDYVSIVQLEDNQVVLRNNILCPYLPGKCIDSEYGMSFWDMTPDTSCEALSYTVLYEGNATRTQNYDISKQETHIIYAVNAGDVIFALETVKQISVCHHPGYQTEHPRLVIAKKTTSGYRFTKKSTTAQNLDLFTYINAKFVYVERHLKTQIENLHAHLIHKKCELERQVLETQLAVAHQHPSEFALLQMKEPGYTAVSRGEVIYLIRCQAVEVTVRKTGRCYNELPVSYNNKSYYMAPTTRLLHEYGTEIPCSSTLMPAYLIHGAWYGFSPNSQRLESPSNLHPSKEVPWRFEDPHDLIKSGIYSFENIDELRRQIMYPTERKAIENVITKTLIGHSMDQQDINVLHLFSPDHFNQIQSYLQPTWSFITGFGNISASLLSIWMIIRGLKYIFCVLINLKLIKTIHGKSWWLLGAFCSSFTTYILHKQEQKKKPEMNIQLTSVVTNEEEERSPNGDAITPTIYPLDTTAPINLESLRQQTKIYPSLNA